MKARSRFSRLFPFALISCALISCTTVQQVPMSLPVPEAELVPISIIVSPTVKKIIPKGSRIVIADIAGECSTEVKDALMRRLIDNSDYDVLTRDNLRQIIGESEITWAGRFNTETAARLGELLGASYFVVGRVAYCGPSANVSSEKGYGSQYNVYAVLQIIDLETGKVIVSSASEGRYTPLPAPDLYPSRPAKVAQIADGALASPPERKDGPVQAVKNFFTPGGGNSPAVTRPPKKAEAEPEPKDYVIIKAAEDMANGFADKFFSRSTWEKVEMWRDRRWKYSESVRYVQLGRCPEARVFLDDIAARELPAMSEPDVAKYLHNYGVVLLCENNSDIAVQKLQSAYRIDYNKTTLRMLGLASKINEWSLRVEVDREPLVGMLLKRDTYVVKN